MEKCFVINLHTNKRISFDCLSDALQAVQLKGTIGKDSALDGLVETGIGQCYMNW